MHSCVIGECTAGALGFFPVIGSRVFVLTEEGDHFRSSLTYAKYDNGMDMLKAYFHARTNEELAEKIRKATFVPNFLKSYSKVFDD